MGTCFSSSSGMDVITPKQMVTDVDDDLVLTQHDHRSPVTPVGMKRIKTQDGDFSNMLNESNGSASTVKLNLERSSLSFNNNQTAVGMKRVLTNESLTGSSTCLDIYSIESQGSVLDTSMAIQTLETSIPLLFAGKTKKGISPNQPSKPNQDSFLMQHHQKTQSMIVAVFDGHGQFGHHVSVYCKEYIASKLPQHSAFATDLKIAINDVILEVEKVMLQESGLDTVFSGTTMTLMVIREGKVTIANLGDSRAVLGMELIPQKSESESKESEPFSAIKVLPLSVDHKPETPNEASRIINHGGRVTVVNGCGRVYLATADVPGLAMSRSLGDFVAHKAGVSSIPDIFEYTWEDLYSRYDKLQDHVDGGKIRLSLMVATDGVFDMMSNEDAMDISLKNWVNDITETSPPSSIPPLPSLFYPYLMTGVLLTPLRYSMIPNHNST